ncbi:MAG: carbohydrate binding domain-containing protein [Armatimonadetes bacterium]|nr:carbohydrate binding domain-containing protein [Armatimonadota bacterium]
MLSIKRHIVCEVVTLWIAVVAFMPTFAGRGETATLAVRASRAASPPTIDGNISDGCYTNALVLKDFVLLDKGTPAAEQTEVSVAYDEESLYFAIHCRESQMAKTVASATGRDASVFADDCIEIFLDANHDHFTYRQFAVSLSGATWDGAGDAAGISPAANLQWTAKTARTEDGWNAEVSIPFASLGLTPQATSTFGLNIAREEKPRGELSSWSPCNVRFGVTPQFGHLEGIGADLTSYKVGLAIDSLGSAILGSNLARVVVTNTGNQPMSYSLTVKVEPPKELPRSLALTPRTFKPGESFPFTAPFELMESGAHRLKFTLTETDSKKLAAVMGRDIAVAPLAEFSLFVSHYRREATLKCRLNVTKEKIRQYSLKVSIAKPDGTADLVTPRVQPLRQAVTDVRLDLRKIPPGEYPVKAVLLDASRTAAAEASLSLSIFKKMEMTPLVAIGQDNTILVQGKAFFPIGIYEMPATEKSIKDAADAGFNLMQAGGGGASTLKTVLDRASKYNLMMWVVMGGNMDLSSDVEARKKVMQDTVAAVGNHPNLLVWESIDEPAWGSQSADGLIAGYRFLRNLDGNHPIWTNHAPRNTITTLAYYNQATDIAGCDIYPVPEPQQQSDLPNKTLAVVADETDKSVASVNGRKPVFMVLQGFGWGELSGGDKSKAIVPTLEQSRFMAYNAIVHGANGILYWGTHYTRKPSKFFSELKSLVSELKCMAPVFLAKPATGPQVRSQPTSVEIAVRELNGNTFIIAVNTKATASRATVSRLPVKDGQKLRLLYDDGKPERLKVVKGQIAFDLEGYGVKVFTTSTAFQAVRKDFSQEYLHPAAAADESLMHQEGNPVPNPSFEVDANGDALPDGWVPQAAFVAEQTTEVAHTGKASLAIHNDDEKAAPLLVQNGIPTTGNRPHLLSAWVKTDHPGVEYRIYVEWVVDGKYYGKVLPWTKGTGEWEQPKVEFTTSPDPKGNLYVVVQLKGKGKVWFDDVALKEMKQQ